MVNWAVERAGGEGCGRVLGRAGEQGSRAGKKCSAGRYGRICACLDVAAADRMLSSPEHYLAMAPPDRGSRLSCPADIGQFHTWLLSKRPDGQPIYLLTLLPG